MSEVFKFPASEDINKTVTAALQKWGRLSDYLSRQDSILIKPNFNTADPFPASTDIAFLKAVIINILDFNPQRVVIGDSSTMFANSQQEFIKKGVYQLTEVSPKIEVLNFEQDRWVKTKITSGKYLKQVSIPQILSHIDKIILLPCLKTHSITQFTGSLKLAVGLMKPRERIFLHLRHTQQKIAELNTVYEPDLIIMDARKCFINKGPSQGEIEEPNIILISDKRVQIDLAGIKIIQGYPNNSLANIDPVDIPQIKRAIEIGIE